MHVASCCGRPARAQLGVRVWMVGACADIMCQRPKPDFWCLHGCSVDLSEGLTRFNWIHELNSSRCMVAIQPLPLTARVHSGCQGVMLAGCDTPAAPPGRKLPRRFDEVCSTLAHICRGKPCQKLAQNAFWPGQTCHQKRPCHTLDASLHPSLQPDLGREICRMRGPSDCNRNVTSAIEAG